MILVSKNTPAIIKSTNPKVPEIVCVKYSTAMIAAISNRITRSVVPILNFIVDMC